MASWGTKLNRTIPKKLFCNEQCYRSCKYSNSYYENPEFSSTFKIGFFTIIVTRKLFFFILPHKVIKLMNL